MPFKDPLTADTVLVRGAIQSPNYIPGVSGWIVRQDGSAEFADLIARGTLESSNYVAGVSGWIINDSGSAEFNDFTARGSLESPNYVPLVTGWAVKADDTAEFNVIRARGDIIAPQVRTSTVQTVPRIWVNKLNAGDQNVIRFYKEDQDDFTAQAHLARILANALIAQNPGLRFIAWGNTGDVDFVGIDVTSGTPGTGAGAIIQLTSPDAVDVFAKEGFFRINAQRVLDNRNVTIEEAAPGANQAVTNVFVDIAGMSVTFTPNFDCEVAVSAMFDEIVGVAIGAGGLALHRLMVDGVAQAKTPYVTADAAHREMTFGTWKVALTGDGSTPHTLKFQVQKSINAGTVTLQSSVTGAVFTITENG